MREVEFGVFEALKANRVAASILEHTGDAGICGPVDLGAGGRVVGGEGVAASPHVREPGEQDRRALWSWAVQLETSGRAA